MLEKAQVQSINEKEVTIIPLITDACVNCNKGTCSKRGKPFITTNPQNLPIKNGDIVQLKISTKYNIIQAFTSLFLPIIVAVIAYFISPPKEYLQAIFVIVGLIGTGIIVTVLSKFVNPKKSKIGRAHV